MNTERKRKSTEDNDEQCKTVKLIRSSSDATEIKKETNILDLNYDCLVALFMHLNLLDLLNVDHAIDLSNIAKTHCQFEGVTEAVFKRKFGQLPITVTNYFESESNNCVKLVNRFGAMVTKLVFDFRLTNFNVVCDAVVKNCSNITELRLVYDISDGVYRIGKNWIAKGQTNQELIKAWQFFHQLGSQFPKLERLTINRNGTEFCEGMESWHTKPIPSLTHFAFSDIDSDTQSRHTISNDGYFDDFDDDENESDDENGSDEDSDIGSDEDGHRPGDYYKNDQDMRFSYKMLKSFIELNPQLTSLSLPMDQIPNDFTSFLDASLPNLTSLKFVSDFFLGFEESFTSNEANHLTNLKELKFQVNSSEHISQFGFLSESLHYLKVQAEEFIATKLVAIISHFSQLKKLKLIVPSRLYYGNDGDVYDREISLDGFEKLPICCKNLTQIILKFEDEHDIYDTYIDELSIFQRSNMIVNEGTVTFNKA